MWKTLSIIAAVLLAGAGAVSYLKQASITEAREELDKAQKNQEAIEETLADAKKALGSKTADLAQAKSDNEADAATLVDLDAEIEKLKSDLETRKEDLATVEAELSDVQEKIAIIGQIDQLTTKVTMLQAEKSAADGKVSNLKSQLTSVLSEKDSSDRVLQGLKNDELYKNSGRMRSNFTGRVAEVSSEYGYVVISAGDSQEVVNGAKLDVVRGGEVIGQLKVTSIEPTRSIADVVPGSFVEGDSVRAGDQVRVNDGSKVGS